MTNNPSVLHRELGWPALLALLVLLLVGCTAVKGMLRQSTVVEVAPAQTNRVTVVQTNWVTEVSVVTNLVAGTNVVTLTNVVVTPVFVTNLLTVVTPAVTYQSNSLAPVVATVATNAGNLAGVAGVPFASTIASGLLGLTTLIFGFLNRRNAARAAAEAAGHAATQSALATAQTIGLTLLDNVETIRAVAKTVPGYTAELDAKAMHAVQQAQRIAGVKSEIHELVETHTV